MGRIRISFCALLMVLLGGALCAQTSSDASAGGANAANNDATHPKSAERISPPAAPPEEYVAGESDLLRISVWKEPDLSQTVVVRPDGNISLPLLKDVQVAGLTPTEIEKSLTEKFKLYITNPQVTVTVQEIRSRKAYITGEVSRPGTYPLVAPVTVLQMIAEAGGFTPFARRNKIFILRREGNTQKRYMFDYSRVVQGISPEQNITLRSGDTVVVP